MTTEHQTTREQEAYGRLLDEMWEEFSEPARTIIRGAQSMAYAENLAPNYCLQIEEYDEATGKMRLAAAELTDRDCELLREYVRAALKASASVDPFDRDTFVKHGASSADLHYYYGMISNMVHRALQHKEELIRQEEMANQDPVDDTDIPF